MELPMHSAAQIGSYRFKTDYRKLNAVTKSDSLPIPRIDDCIDKIGNAQYVSKDARGVMVIVVGNGHGDTSSNPGRD